MKIITEIKQVGKSEKYKLYLNEEFAFFVSLESIYKNSLRQGEECSEETLTQAEYESDKFFAFNMALKYMTDSLRTKKQLNEYLYKKNFNKQIREETIEKIENYGYVNDKEYAERYIESKKKQKGVNLIKQHLFTKGISKEIMEEVLKDFSQEEEIKKIALKFLKNKEKDEGTKQKLYRHLVSKGFTYGEAMKTVTYFFSGEDYDWN